VDYFAALRAFTRSVELGSFSKAAAEQTAKVSTISRHVRALEDDVGAALLNRSTRRLRLTEAGAALYERATHILAELDAARVATKELNSRPQGLLRVAAPRAFGRRSLASYLPAFLTAYPDIRLDLMLEDRMIDLIEARADVAIRMGALQDSSLVARRIGPHERIPVASPSYLANLAPIQQPGDLQRVDCMIYAPDVGARWTYRPKSDAQADPLGVAVGGRVQINDLDALLDMAIDGLGVALLPRWLVAGELRSGLLVALLAEWVWAVRPGPEPAIWAVYPPKRVVSPKVRVFIDFVAERIKRETGWG
jgi:DNA-binding transcriptional LysR family regulator